MYIHIVKAGETINSIAASYGIAPEKLVSDNGLFNLPYLVVGQALIILIPQIIQTVSEGESIYSIARLYSLTPIELIQKNPSLAARTEIYQGEQLTIMFANENQSPISI